jgi:hypothetical protein
MSRPSRRRRSTRLLVTSLSAVLCVAVGGFATATAAPKAPVASASKKKKKKKKHHSTLPTPAPTTPTTPPASSQASSTPTVATLPSTTNIASVAFSWCGGTVDLDLHVWNKDGAHAGFKNGSGIQNQISGGTHSADDPGESCSGGHDGGLETYSDTAGNSHGITIGICYAQNNEAIHPIPSWQLDILYTNGSTYRYSNAAIGPQPGTVITPNPLQQPGDQYLFVPALAGGAYVPGDFCPSP